MTERPLKICLISLYAYKLFRPHDEKVPPFAGSEVQQFQLGRALAQYSPHEVSFMVGDFYASQPRMELLKMGKKKVELYKTVRCGRRIWGWDSLVDCFKLYRAMKKINADVYVLRGGGALTGTMAFLAKRVFNKRFIYSSAHDRDSNGEFFKTHSSPINFLFRYGLRHADFIVCQHGGQQEAFLQNLGLNAVVIRSMYPLPDSIPPRSKRRTILWVSRLVDWKQPDVFVELARRFPHESFVMVTQSASAGFLARHHNIKNLSLVEAANFESMDEYFQRAKVFVNTSISEGFPNTFVQAAKNGTPILSLNVDPDSMLKLHRMGACAKGNFDQLVEELRTLLSTPNGWEECSNHAHRYAKQHHSIQKNLARYLKLFYDALHETRSS